MISCLAVIDFYTIVAEWYGTVMVPRTIALDSNVNHGTSMLTYLQSRKSFDDHIICIIELEPLMALHLALVVHKIGNVHEHTS